MCCCAQTERFNHTSKQMTKSEKDLVIFVIYKYKICVTFAPSKIMTQNLLLTINAIIQ